MQTVQRMLIWLAAACLGVSVAACRPAARPQQPPAAPAVPEAGEPGAAPEPDAAAPDMAAPDAAAADPAATPELAGGPEHGNRPHYDPPKPPEFAYMRGDRRFRTVALTFDDGPDAVYTPRVLDVLKQHGVPATFFLVGRRVAAHPRVARRIIREGHEVGNHSWDHAYLPRLKPPAMASNLKRADTQIRQATRRPVTLFRPPYGSATAEIGRASRQLGYRTILWNVDSLDWKKISHEEVAHNVLPNVRPGAIVLFHSAGGKGEDLTNTVRALPLIIRALRGQGYRFVTVSELLATGQPRPGVW